MRKILVRPVGSRKDLRNFIHFPWNVYRDDSRWVPPLIIDVKEKLDVKKNPFFEHAERELFLAYRDDEIVGRVVGIVDQNHNAFHDEKIAFFGMFESLNDNDAAIALLDAVAAWGKERGMDTLRGTVNLSLNDECAFLIEGFDSRPTVMMPYNPRYYADLMEACGAAKAKDLYAFMMSRDHETTEKVKAIVHQIRQTSAVTCRPLNKKNIDEEADKIVYVYNHAWEKNWGFVPWTEHEMSHTVKTLKQIADFDLVILAEDEGKPVGFAFALPDYNEVLAKMNGRLYPFGIFKLLLGRKKIKGMRALVFGILKDYRNTGVSYLLYSELEKQGLRKGYEWCEMSWLLEDNEQVNRFCASIGGKLYKKYRIYEKKIV